MSEEMLGKIVDPIIIAVVGAVVGLFIQALKTVGLKAVAAFEARTGLHVAEKDQQTVRDAVNTASGQLIVELASGRMKLNQIAADAPAVVDLAKAAIARVPGAAASLGGVTAGSIAEVVVGAVGQAIKEDAVTPIVPTLPVGRTLPPFQDRPAAAVVRLPDAPANQ